MGGKKKGKKEYVTKPELYRAISKAIESKYYYTYSATTAGATGALFAITNGITQGDGGVGTRDGDRISPIRVRMKGFCTVADSTNFVRILIVRWKEDYADLTSVDQILETTGSTMSATSMFVVEPEQRKRFEVLGDRLISLHTYKPTKAFDLVIPAKKLKKPVQYVAGTSGGNGQIVGVLISDSTAVSHPGVSYELLVQYKDG